MPSPFPAHEVTQGLGLGSEGVRDVLMPWIFLTWQK